MAYVEGSLYGAAQSCETEAVTDSDDLASRLARTAEQLRALFEDGSPAVLRGAGPLFETAEVFEWIKRAHPQARASTSLAKIHALKRGWGLDVDELPSAGEARDPGRPAEMYRGGAMLLEPAPFLPRPDHASFADWVRETHAALGGEFGMQAPGLECACFDALDRLQALLGPTLALTGPRTYRYNAFVGDYRRTPFGFHVDPHQEAVFQYVVEGRRQVSFWEGLILQDRDADWVEDANGLVRPRTEPEHRFELEPGDIVFWPGTHVHGFAPEGPSMALSMVIDRACPRSRAEVVAALEVETMGGQAALPPPNGDEDHDFVTRGTTLRRRSSFPIAYARWEDALIIGVCGRTFEWPERASIAAAIELFDGLNERERVVVDELVEATTLFEDDLLELLTMFTGLGWLRRV
ncbi:hypothetical protein ENSA5_04080 [Enhygromyxa salina]|uniref:JmjC domain-containing protein n=1 Tax=Enhygromyxa salina TaxID=215803 RepID=A0A2S9YJL0_9BACT|nr:cupin domain-containing protein [Enhygromyxa salina]PRQ05289.1 hypothetical protein ENSA5_04080 [Enhygromyxa salina]